MATDNPSPRAQKPARIQRFKISINILVQLFAITLILLMLNYLSFNHYRRWDFTRTHRYALSEKTKHVLAGLKKTVKVVVVFPVTTGISIDVSNLLKEYQYSSNGKIEVEVVDPERNPTRATELENTYKFDSKDSLVILDDGEHRKFIKAIDLVDIDTTPQMYNQQPQLKDFKGEQAVTGALLELTEDKPNVLYAITGHGERDIAGADFESIRVPIERENVQIKPLDLQNVEAVPDDAGILLILGARYDFSDREIKILKNYWEKKGRLIILLDPDAQSQTPQNGQSQTPHLTGFLAEQHVFPDNDRILRVTQTQLSAAAVVAGLVRDVTGNFIEGSPVTKNLKGVTGLFLGGTQSLALDQDKAQAAGIRFQMLVQASNGYWGETDYNIHDGDAVPYFQPKKDIGQPLVVVASVEKGALNDPRMQVDSSRMIVAGNWQFISQQSLSQPNLDFTINGIDWLLDRVELIGITPKGYNSLSMNLTDNQLSNILSITMFLIPTVAGVFGFALWWKRRH